MKTVSKTIQRSLLALTIVAGLVHERPATAAMKAIEEAITYASNRKATRDDIGLPASIAVMFQFLLLTARLADATISPRTLVPISLGMMQTEEPLHQIFRFARNISAAIALINLARAKLNIDKAKETHTKKKLSVLNTLNALRQRFDKKTGQAPFDLALSFLPTRTFNLSLYSPYSPHNYDFYIQPCHRLPDGKLVIQFRIQSLANFADYNVHSITIDGTRMSETNDRDLQLILDAARIDYPFVNPTRIEDPFVRGCKDYRELKTPDGSIIKITASRDPNNKNCVRVAITIDHNPLSSGLGSARTPAQKADKPAAPAAPERDMAPAYPASFMQVGPSRAAAAAPAAPILRQGFIGQAPEAMESKRG